MYAPNYHSYTHLIPNLGIVRELTVRGVITSPNLSIHDIGRATPVRRAGGFIASADVGKMGVLVFRGQQISKE